MDYKELIRPFTLEALKESEEALTAKEMAEVACALNLLKEYQSVGSVEHFRELVQAEKDGRLVVLPCKVGDTVYQTDGLRVYECKVKKIVFDTDGVGFDDEAIGKYVFLTREEAEAALKKREEKIQHE